MDDRLRTFRPHNVKEIGADLKIKYFPDPFGWITNTSWSLTDISNASLCKSVWNLSKILLRAKTLCTDLCPMFTRLIDNVKSIDFTRCSCSVYPRFEDQQHGPQLKYLVLEQNRSHRACAQNSHQEGDPRESPTHNLTKLSAEHLTKICRRLSDWLRH